MRRPIEMDDLGSPDFRKLPYGSNVLLPSGKTNLLAMENHYFQ